MKNKLKVHLSISLQTHTRLSHCSIRKQPNLTTNSPLNRRESWKVVCCGSRLTMLMIKYTLREHCLTNASLLLSNAVSPSSASHGGFLLVAWGVSAYPEKWFYRRSLYSKSTVMHAGLERVIEVSRWEEEFCWRRVMGYCCFWKSRCGVWVLRSLRMFWAPFDGL